MKKIITVALYLATTMLLSAQVITGFGSSETNPFSNAYGLWSGTVGLTTMSVTNASDMDAPAIYSLLSSQVSMLGKSSISLTGTLNATASADHFRIYLYDASYYSAYADFYWSTFSGGASVSQSLSNDLSSGGTFNASTVSAWSLTTYGNGGTISFTFDNLSAVPEPSVMMLLGVSLCAFVMWRSLGRRQVNA